MTHRSLFGLAAAVATLSMTFALAQDAAATSTATSVIGKWRTIDDETKKPKSIVEIYEENGKIYGRIEKLIREPNEEQDPKCDKCEGALKDQRITGMQILKNLQKKGNEWSGGTILDPGNGKTYSVILGLEDGGKKLKVRGYIGLPFIGRTQYWHRVTE